MRTFRIGNDLPISWRVLRCGKPEDFQGKSLKLYLTTRYGRILVNDFLVRGNVITFLYPGGEQVVKGDYGLLLIENNGADGMYTVAVDRAFALTAGGSVACECTLDVDIVTDIDIPSNGLSAYELAVLGGFAGTKEEWLASLKGEPFRYEDFTPEQIVQLQTPATDAAEKVLRTESEIKTAERTRVTAEQQRQRDTAAAIADARSATQAAQVAANAANDAAQNAEELNQAVRADESRREQNESARKEAEEARKSSEDARVDAEKKRDASEQQRQADTAEAISNAKAATQDARDAAAVASENVLAIEFDKQSGELNALVGSEGSAFDSGHIEQDGAVVLDFNYN